MFNFLQAINSSKLENFIQNIKEDTKQTVMGLSASDKGLFLGLAGKGSVFVAKDIVSSGKIAEQVSAFNLKTQFITGPYENAMGLKDTFLSYDFLSIISNFVRGKIDILFITTDALFQKIPSKKSLLENVFKLEKNKDYDLFSISKKLTEMGYTRTEFVASRGQFSINGDILQICPIDMQELIKLEFFDTNLEKISKINIEERKFIEELNALEIIAIDYPKNESNVLNLASKIFFDEPKQLEDIASNFAWAENFVMQEKIFASEAKSQTAFSNLNAKSFFKTQDIINFQKLATKKYVFDFKELTSDLEYFKNTGKKVYLFCQDEKKKERLENFLEQNFVFINTLKDADKFIFATADFLPYSISFTDSNAVLIGTYDLFKKEKQKDLNKKAVFYTPKPGEFVVHTTHGIGKCVGLEKHKFTDYEKEYFIIEYANGDKLYLPTEQSDAISAFYSGDKEPKLNKLGGIEFAKIKEKVYKNVKQIAFDLLELYAKREKSIGNVYVKDDYLMEMFETAFPYEETADQLQAINDIKADMESKRIMDRLVCGDVGYGKTEVALRAIYKAVLSGKQVAFLCPTTILAEQHFKTCLARFSGFMVKVARFNRLIKKPEQDEVLKGLANGSVNVVCGTHKLLNDKIKFKNLSLLVLDEEQRFGVEDKEKIKNMKNNIDVLSLSATPIPRTLHMSLSGIRDISIIDTPPKERLPIQTFVAPQSDDLIVRACKQELGRNGQVLIIFNRIDKIYDFTNKLRSLLPNVNIGVAHGRLSPKLLENSIMKLYNHEYQILVATTLIENGIDLPSANTLIVIDADKLGLSQLYQIRGRIGRSNKTAFAYLTYKENKKLTNTAYQRLTAIMEHTALGSGFKIAMADLEIRGAGNVLGKEQHGNMAKVGYDLYYKLLNMALKEIKGEKTDDKKDIKLDINISAFIPENYIPNEEQRIKIYGQISGLNSQEQMQELKTNLLEVYGKIPAEIDNLMKIVLVKNFAVNQDIKRIVINQTTCKIYFYDKKDIIFTDFETVKQKLEQVLQYLSTKANV